MEYLPSIMAVILLFLLGVISPGPNFIVLVNRSLNGGFKSGVTTGLGIALGDCIYAGLGLFGLATIIERLGWLLSTIKLLGGLYLMFLGYKMLKSKKINLYNSAVISKSSMFKCFKVGLLTDLANPKTVIFFTSIFATTVQPKSPIWVLFAMLIGIVLTSILWRIGLSYIFTRHVLRNRYLKYRKVIETIFGCFLILFGLKMASNPLFSEKS